MANPKITIEVKDTGIDRVEKRLKDLNKKVAELGKVEGQSARKAEAAARTRSRALQMQKKLIEENFQKLVRTNAEVAKMGKKGRIDANVAAFNRMQNALGQGALKMKDLAQVQGSFDKQLSKSTRELNRASNGHVIYNTNIRKSVRGMTSAKNNTNGLTNALRNLGSAAVLTAGPLSGFGSRVIALGAIAQRSGSLVKGLRIAALFALFSGLVVLVGKAIAAFKQFEAQMLALRSILRTTGKDARITAEGVNEIVESLDKLTLGGSGELRGAALRALTFEGVDSTNIARILEISQDIAALDFTNTSNAALRLGRAIEDPVGNLELFRRAGIQFTQAEKNLIETLVNFNQRAEAAAVILNKFNKIQGAAREQAKGLAGEFDGLAFEYRKLLEVIGGGTKGAVEFVVRMWRILIRETRFATLAIGTMFSTVFENITEIVKGNLSTVAKTLTDRLSALRSQVLGKTIPVPKPKPGTNVVATNVGLDDKALSKVNKLLRDNTAESFKLLLEVERLTLGFNRLNPKAVDFARSLIKGNTATSQTVSKMLETNKELKKLNDSYNKLDREKLAVSIWREQLGPMDQFILRQKQINILVGEGNLLHETAAKATENNRRELFNLGKEVDIITRTFRTLHDSVNQFGEALINAFTTGENFARSFRAALKSLVDQLIQFILRIAVLEPILKLLRSALTTLLPGLSKLLGIGATSPATVKTNTTTVNSASDVRVTATTISDVVSGTIDTIDVAVIQLIKANVIQKIEAQTISGISTNSINTMNTGNVNVANINVQNANMTAGTINLSGNVSGGGGSAGSDVAKDIATQIAVKAITGGFGGGFQSGGSFNVPGSGGSDSKLVMFKATPGENVSVKTRADQRRGSRGGDTFIVDMRGADKDAVLELRRMIRDLDANLEERSVAANLAARNNDPNLFGRRR